jgi:hypothetical protein
VARRPAQGFAVVQLHGQAFCRAVPLCHLHMALLHGDAHGVRIFQGHLEAGAQHGDAGTARIHNEGPLCIALYVEKGGAAVQLHVALVGVEGHVGQALCIQCQAAAVRQGLQQRLVLGGAEGQLPGRYPLAPCQPGAGAAHADARQRQ